MLAIGIIGGVAGGIFRGIGFGALAGFTCFGGALSQRISPPFIGWKPLKNYRTLGIFRLAMGIFCALAIETSSDNERVQKIACAIAYVLAITTFGFVGYVLARKISI